MLDDDLMKDADAQVDPIRPLGPCTYTVCCRQQPPLPLPSLSAWHAHLPVQPAADLQGRHESDGDLHWLQAKAPSPAKPADKPKPTASATRGLPSSTTKKGAKASPQPAAASAASADASELGIDATAPGDDIEVEVGSAAA